VTGVGNRKLPLELIRGLKFGKQQFMQPLPHPCLLPGPQPAPDRHPAAKTELLGEVLPADPGVQDEQDPCNARRSSNGLRPGYRNRRGFFGSNGSIRSHKPSDTSHGFALIDTLPNLDDRSRRTSLPQARSLHSVRASKSVFGRRPVCRPRGDEAAGEGSIARLLLWPSGRKRY
jgi:hypothetical protein